MRNEVKGALFVVLSGLCFASMGAVIKLSSQTLPSEVIVFFRNFFGFLFLIPFFFAKNALSVRTSVLPLHLARGFVGFLAMYTFFYGISVIPLSEAVLLSYTTPLFAPLIALLLLGERFGVRLVMAMLLGFVGVALILKPDTGLNGFNWGAMVALSSGLFAALALTIVRRLSKSEPAPRIVFYHTGVGLLASIVPAILFWVTPTLSEFLWLVLIGLLASLGQLAITRGYSLAPVARAGPFMYTTVVFAGMYGWMLWGEVPDLLSFGGTILVCVAGVLATWYGGKTGGRETRRQD